MMSKQMLRSFGPASVLLFFAIAFTSCASTSSTVATREGSECSREWALAGLKNQSFKVVGLGLSTEHAPQKAQDEAQTAATKDILLQLQSNVESRAEIHRTSSSASFKSDATLTARMENLNGIKVLKTGRNLQDRITRCIAAEFDVQAAHRELASQLEAKTARFAGLVSDSEGEALEDWVSVLKALPEFRKVSVAVQPLVERADVFKTFLRAPGPGWAEKISLQLNQLEKADQTIRSHLVFVLVRDPQKSFEGVLADVEGSLTQAGARSVVSAKEVGADDIGIELKMENLGTMTSSKTSLGETVSRKIAVRLTDVKSGKLLGSTAGVTVSATSAENLEGQMVSSALETIRKLVPGLIRN